jgi:hypothetical protein
MSIDVIEEGFWRKTKDEYSPLPWPVPDVAWTHRIEFLQGLDRIEEAAQCMDWMGYSACRLCGQSNGASEFRAGRWVWPEGYRHYITEHLVRPTADFEAFVLSANGNGSLPPGRAVPVP